MSKSVPKNLNKSLEVPEDAKKSNLRSDGVLMRTSSK